MIACLRNKSIRRFHIPKATSAFLGVLPVFLGTFSAFANSSTSQIGDLQYKVMKSLSCADAPQNWLVLSQQIKDLAQIKGLDQVALKNESELAVNRWCHLQMAKSRSSIPYCQRRYQPQMEAFMGAALNSEPSVGAFSMFDVEGDRVVAPHCKLSPVESRALKQSYLAISAPAAVEPLPEAAPPVSPVEAQASPVAAQAAPEISTSVQSSLEPTIAGDELNFAEIPMESSGDQAVEPQVDVAASVESSHSQIGDLQFQVMKSLTCADAPQHWLVLAQQIKDTAHSRGLDQATLQNESEQAVNKWCNLQLVKSSTSLPYCQRRYQPQIDAFMAVALKGEQSVSAFNMFNVQGDRVVAPHCKLSPVESRSLKQAYSGISPLKVSERTLASAADHKAEARRDSSRAQTTLTEVEAASRQSKDENAGVVGRILSKVGRVTKDSFKKDLCPESEKIYQALRKGELLARQEAGTLANNSYRCESVHPYNQNILNEINLVYSDLDKIQAKHPSQMDGSGKLNGGYKLSGYGTNLPFNLANRYEFSGDLGPSYCSAALFNVFTRTLSRLDKGAIFSKMTQAQLDNFIPRNIAKYKGGSSDIKGNLDNYGVYGIINNSGDGIRDLNKAMGAYSFGVDIAKGARGTDKFKGACAGDMMQWDRAKEGSGHSGVFLAEVKGKTYFWSANSSTQGYGVTCEVSSNMIPKIVRLTQPYNMAAIPEMKQGQMMLGSEDFIKKYSKRAGYYYSHKSYREAEYRPDVLQQVLPALSVSNASRDILAVSH